MAHVPLARIIAHRGASADAPENTLSALSMAADHGASCVEIDVSISSDDIAYVHHDHDLERCTNGQGKLCEHSSVQLDLLKAGKNMQGFEEEPLPRLSAVLSLLIERGLGLNLEVKPVDGLEQRTVDAIYKELKDTWPQNLPLVASSFNHKSLELLKARMPSIAIAPLVGSIPDNWLSLLQSYDAQNLHCAAGELSHEKAKDVVDAGYGLYCYTVNDVSKARELFNSGVHGVFTDHPKSIRAQLES